MGGRMNISEEILDNLREVFATQRITSLTGTYDGTTAELSMTFFEGDTEVETFEYLGVEYTEFKNYLFEAGGRCVQRHNANYYVQDRTAFIASVTG